MQRFIEALLGRARFPAGPHKYSSEDDTSSRDIRQRYGDGQGGNKLLSRSYRQLHAYLSDFDVDMFILSSSHCMYFRNQLKVLQAVKMWVEIGSRKPFRAIRGSHNIM